MELKLKEIKQKAQTEIETIESLANLEDFEKKSGGSKRTPLTRKTSRHQVTLKQSR